jgi:hypothetical protein
MANARQPHIFISYARADDEAFVSQLRDDLVREGITVWWDRVSMESRGKTFFVELRDAIEAADRVLAVIGPAAVGSLYVQSEWEHAALFSKAVLLVLRKGDYSLAPPEIADLPGVDFRPQREPDVAFQELVRMLREPVAPLAPLPGVPALPKYFTPRRSDIARLSDVVLADAHRAVPVGPAGQTTALHGMGGIGKSVVAAALARTTEARRVFTDGIIWLRIGKQPDLLTSVRVLVASFHEDISTYTDGAVALTQLSDVLQSRKCMIVLDDVWVLEHATPFHDALGPLCRLLVTTRDAGLAAALGTDVDLGFLTPGDALRLLADSGGQTVAQLPQDANQVARECGNLPLALAMAGGIARGKEGWTGVLARLRSADLAKLRGIFPGYPYPDLLRAFEASIDCLDKKFRDRYFDLAVLAENTSIPEAALATFWKEHGLNRFDVEDTVGLFVERSLARRTSSGAISLHDLQLIYVRAGTPTIAELQRRFVEAYLAGKEAGAWALVPDDGYFHEHITWHLEQAGWQDRIHMLLAAAREDGRNAWHEAASQTGRLVSYHADLARGTRLAIAANEVVLQIRYALIAASIRSAAENLSPALLRQLLATGTWTEGRALDYALQIPDVPRKAASLASLAELLSPPGREQLLAAARDLQDRDAAASAILVGALARCDDPELARKAFALAKTMPDEEERAAAVAAAAPHLPDEHLDYVLPLLKRFHYTDSKLQVMRAIVSRLSEEGLDELHWMCREELYVERKRKEALQVIAPYLSAGSLPPNDLWEYTDKEIATLLPHVAKVDVDYALRRACKVGDWDRAEALAAVVPVLARTAPERAVLWMRRIHNEKFKADALARSAAYFTGGILDRAMKVARKLKVRECHATALSALCPNLAPEERQQALQQAADDLIQSVYLEHSEERRVDAIVLALSQFCRFGQSGLALRLVESIGDGPRRAEALAGIGECLEEDYLERAFEMVFEMPGDGPRAVALKGIVRRLPKELVLKARAKLKSSESLAVTGPYLSPKNLDDALQEVEEHWVYAAIPLAVDALAPSLKEASQLNRAVGIASGINDGYPQVAAECSLARQLTEPRRTEIVSAALERAARILDYGSRSHALSEVAKEAPAAWTDRIEREAVALKYDVYSDPLRAVLAARLFELGVYEAALLAAERIEPGGLSKTEALLPAARQVSGPLIDSLMRIIAGSADDDMQLDLLSALAPRLSPAALAAALGIVRKMEHEESRSKGLVELARYLPPDGRNKALQCARAIGGSLRRARALAGLAPHLEPELRSEVVAEALAAVTSKSFGPKESESDRAEALELLGPLVSESGMKDLLRAIAAIPSTSQSYALKALKGIAPLVPEILVPEFLKVLEAAGSEPRGEVEAEIIVRLLELSDTALAQKIFDSLSRSRVTPQAWLAMALGPGLEEFESDLQHQWYFWDDRDRADALTGVPGSWCDRAARWILQHTIAEAPKNVAVLAALMPRIAGWPREALLAEWNRLYPAFATRRRSLVLLDIAHMAPLLCRLGEEGIAYGIFGAIQDVVRSWP